MHIKQWIPGQLISISASFARANKSFVASALFQGKRPILELACGCRFLEIPEGNKFPDTLPPSTEHHLKNVMTVYEMLIVRMHVLHHLPLLSDSTHLWAKRASLPCLLAVRLHHCTPWRPLFELRLRGQPGQPDEPLNPLFHGRIVMCNTPSQFLHPKQLYT